MSNRQLSSSKKCPPALTDSKINRRKENRGPRSPLQDINGITRSNSSSSSSVSVEAPRGCLRFFLSNHSSSRTPLHGLKVKTLSKPPQTAPNARPAKPSSFRSKPSKENLPKPASQKPKKNPPCLCQWQSGKKPSSRTGQKPKPSPDLGSSGDLANNSAPRSQEFSKNQQHLQQQQRTELFKFPDLSNAVVENSTPVNKLACGSALDGAFEKPVGEDSTTTATTTTTTPPVQASLSPEIQCGSSMLVSAATPTCYGAGHVVSGVTDRRKCKRRGILTVGDNDLRCGKADAFDYDDENVVEILNKSRVSLVPPPAEASMRWLPSPCDEQDEDQKRNSANGSHLRRMLVDFTTLLSLSSPPSGHVFSSVLCNNANHCGATNTNTSTSGGRESRITLLSPRGTPESQRFLGSSSHQAVGCSSLTSPQITPSYKAVTLQEERKYRYNLAEENSPFSIDSLGSGNVIQTPQSDSSSERHVGPSWLNVDDDQKHNFDSELDLVEEVIRRASLSPKNQISMWNLPDLSFPFADLTSPSNSIDLTQLPKTWDKCASCISGYTLDNVSPSQMRISWRDGLMSRIFEMDELDCCRCLSDDENDSNGCRNDQLKSHWSDELIVDVGNDQIFNNDFGSPEIVNHKLKLYVKGEEKSPLQRANSCAESICTDGGGLVASGDSDWTLSYKNQLFEV
ncbi:hypothetical protein F0562_006675 [Nyssa sinensis]|uniref:Uncharacterized protein n=1 Tax=Nyssa sinensis TaxID=561372 RepID=A0A5J5AR27_9ASTE|nr:hypothetical protein F0562_006675 [Nyssa sinensis]